MWELTQLVDEPQSLVSYHLRQLRDGGLVSSRRSSADGRDAYYAINLTACQDGLQAAGGALHPGLWLAPARLGAWTSRSFASPAAGVVLVHGEQRAVPDREALLEHMSAGTVETASGAAIRSRCINAVRVLRKRGIDISANRTKHLDDFTSERFDMVITLCDRVRRSARSFRPIPSSCTGASPTLGLEGPTNRMSYPAFERTFAELETRSASCSVCCTTCDKEEERMPNDETVNVRYMVDDVDESIVF